MKRLIKDLGKNTPQEYNRIFSEREKKGIDFFDKRRWETLLEKYKGGKLVDLGCLDSLVTMMAKERFPKAEIWGFDIAPKVIAKMERKHPNVFFHCGNVYDTKFAHGFFNYVVAGEIIEHLDEPEKFFKEAFRILRPYGIMAISTPLEEEKEVGAVDGERHIWSYTEEDIRKLTEKYGEVIDVRVLRSVYEPEYRYCWPQLIVWVKKR